MKKVFTVFTAASVFCFWACDNTSIYRTYPVTSASPIATPPSTTVPVAPLPVPTVTVIPSPLPIQNLSCAVYDLSANGLGSGTIPDFESLSPIAAITLGSIDAPSTNVSSAFQLFPPALSAQLRGAYGLDCDSYLVVPATGPYNFAISSDDGSQLFIDGSLVISDNGAHGMNVVTGSARLTAGKHKLHLVAAQNGLGQQGLELAWEQPQDQFYTIIPDTSFSH